MWNQRYDTPEYVYGKEPNLFFRDSLENIGVSGTALFPAEGEGRNAVWAAQKGLSVFAFDYSEAARKKALRLAKEAGVDIGYRVGEIREMDYPEEFFDLVVLTYAHFAPGQRKSIHTRLVDLLKPGGVIILEGFSLKNLKNREENPSAGGPANPDMLFTPEILRDDFSGLEFLKLGEYSDEIYEGVHHNGKAMLIRMIARKS